MSYRRRAGGGRRDIAEKPITDALQAAGAEFWKLSGTGCPDILARYKGRYYVAEVKTGTAKETANQGAFDIWRTPEDALIGIGARKP